MTAVDKADMAARTFPITCWEDFTEGEVFEFGAHPVTKDEILAFGHEYDPEPFHTDEAAASASMLGGLIASGLQMLAWLRSLHCRAMPDVGWTLSPGWDDVRFVQPVRPGDVVTVWLRVTSARTSESRPGWGIIVYDAELRDQTGEVKLACKPIVFYRRRDAAQAE